MSLLKSFCSRVLLAATPWQALRDALLLDIVLLLSILSLRGSYVAISQMDWALLAMFSAILWYVLRLRVPAKFMSRDSFLDLGVVTLLTVVSGLILIGFASLLELFDMPPSRHWTASNQPAAVLLVAVTMGTLWFLFLRVCLRGWLGWDRLRRTQLVWALTHVQLMLVALAGGLVIVLIDCALIIIGSVFFKVTPLSVVPVTLVMLLLTAMGMMLALPIAIIISYLGLSRTVRRIKHLTHATSALRAGNYAVRVLVEGEDEVAQLQNDFNATATELERARQELQDERDTVASLLQSRRELLANVSHELRTPVATLRGYLETTLIHWESIPPPTLHHDLRVMEDEIIRLQSLVEDLFSLARSEVGQLSLHCKPADIGQLVQHAIDTTAPLAWQSSKITVVSEVPPILPLAMIDATRIEQALQNLLRNAIRHTSPGGIVAIVVTIEPEAITLQVKDTGEGIAPADLPHIWNRFYQTERTRSRGDGGAGLGLALVKEWVEAMGGSVGIESMPGAGSCFSMRLPIHKNILIAKPNISEALTNVHNIHLSVPH